MIKKHSVLIGIFISLVLLLTAISIYPGGTYQDKNSVGFDYFDESEFNDLIIANKTNNLGLVLEHQLNPRAESVAELFNKIENWNEIIQSNPEEMKSLPSYRNYLLWYDRLKVAFVSVCDIPNYDIEANEKLGTIIIESETVKY